MEDQFSKRGSFLCSDGPARCEANIPFPKKPCFTSIEMRLFLGKNLIRKHWI